MTAAELLLGGSLVAIGPGVRYLPGSVYLYLFVVLWAAFRWGFLHAVFATSCALFLYHFWLRAGSSSAGIRLEDERHLIMFAIVALGISAILSVVRQEERTLQSSYEMEREVARVVQKALTPDACPVPGYDVAFSYHPASRASRVGGDFIDVFALDQGRYGILLGDVTGHGVEASVQTAEIRYGIRSLAHRGLSPEECIRTIDEVLGAVRQRDRYATAFLGVIDTTTHTLTYTSAGHEPGLLRRSINGSLEALPYTGPMLGIPRSVAPGADLVRFAEKVVSIDPGDGLVLYTDGVTEARTSSRVLRRPGSGEAKKGRSKPDFYGLDRLESFIRARAETVASDAVKALYEAVGSFAGWDLRDDVAVLWIRRLPSEPR